MPTTFVGRGSSRTSSWRSTRMRATQYRTRSRPRCTQAAEIACGNAPSVAGSGRHRSRRIRLDAVGGDGHRGRGATSKMRCVDVAAVFTAAILRRYPATSVVIPFDDRRGGQRHLSDIGARFTRVRRQR